MLALAPHVSGRVADVHEATPPAFSNVQIVTFMKLATDFLDPRAKLVDAVADWLVARRLRDDPSGAKSLTHVCVVAPTAQSGRNLRLALARRFSGGGILPPLVVQPMRLVAPKDNSLREATDAEVAAMFLVFARSRPARRAENGRVVELLEWNHLFRPESFSDPDALFSFLSQLSDIWNVLGAGGLLMRDVPSNERARKILEEAVGDEAERWRELAELETAFFEILHANGLRHRAESLNLAKSAAAPPPAGVDEIVLPALSDPVPVLHDVLSGSGYADTNVTVLLHCEECDRDKFDKWGRPRVECWTGVARPALQGLSRSDIVRVASDSQLADRLAADFPEAGSAAEAPALGLCDENLFPELSGAFSRRGNELHDPARFRLSASSLGRLAGFLVEVYECGVAPWPWSLFSALFREYDVLRRLTSGNGGPARDGDAGSTAALPSRAAALTGLDAYRNAAFPVVFPQNGNLSMSCFDPADPRQKVDLEHAQQFARLAAELAKMLREARRRARGVASFLRLALADIYRGVRLGGHAGADVDGGAGESPETMRRRMREESEFAAAIASLNGVLESFESTTIRDSGLDDPLLTALLRKGLSEAVYSLEPDSGDVLTTEGWLELPWSGRGKVALAGFNEGSVPETVAGHVFLPESLRAALGLPSNDSRLARDVFLLSELISSRDPGDVRAYFSRTGADGDIHRPSRLLFLVEDDKLPDRVGDLFGSLPAETVRPRRRVAEKWRPRLPREIPPLPGDDATTPGGRLSASSIGDWLECPFAYFLKDALKMERVEEKSELAANDFGTLVHAALERYARRQLERTGMGEEQLSNHDDIRDELMDIFRGVRESFGRSPSLNLRLQLASAETRILAFAEIQAFWRSEAGGAWQVAATPEYKFRARAFAGEGDPLLEDVWIKGMVDRIDYSEAAGGYRLIDYKTWDSKSKAKDHVLSKGADEAEHARILGLPLLPRVQANAAERRILSVQLPLYARALEKALPENCDTTPTPPPTPFAGHIADCCYVILGKTAADTGVFGSIFQHPKELEAQSRNKFAICDDSNFNKSLETARIAARRIRQGIFWPPGPGTALRYGLGDIFLDSPARDLACSDWVREQERRLGAAVPKVSPEAQANCAPEEKDSEKQESAQ